MPLAPDVPYEIGDYAFGGYVAGVIDTTQGNIIAADASQTGLRYILIVSPKSLEQTSLAWKNGTTAGPVATQTRWDGLSATVSMASATYPAANYCYGLTYPADNASRWYLPAMDELEVIYRNLKSTTEANYTTAQTRAAGSFPYSNGANASVPGYNPSSDPAGPAYTSGDPAQTTVAAFVDGGGQDLGDVGVNQYFWTSTEYNEFAPWYQHASGSSAGYQITASKESTFRVRPVRRILVSDLNAPPNAPTLVSPVDGATIDRATGQRFEWQFNDPDAGDTQSAYSLRYRAEGAGSWTETGWVSTPATFHDFAAATFTDGVTYEWQVATKDAQGVEGPFSASSFFTAGTAPTAPTVTSPPNGGTFAQSQLVEWSTPDQNAYQVQTLDGAVVVTDTGTVESSTARSRVVSFPDNGVTRSIAVRVRHGGLWSPWTTITGTVSWVAPPAPMFTLTPNADDGSLLVSIINPAPTGPEPALAYNTVEVDDDDGKGWSTRYGSAQVAGNGTWTYHLPRGTVDYDQRVRVTAVGDNNTSTTTTGAS